MPSQPLQLLASPIHTIPLPSTQLSRPPGPPLSLLAYYSSPTHPPAAGDPHSRTPSQPHSHHYHTCNRPIAGYASPHRHAQSHYPHTSGCLRPTLPPLPATIAQPPCHHTRFTTHSRCPCGRVQAVDVSPHLAALSPHLIAAPQLARSSGAVHDSATLLLYYCYEHIRHAAMKLVAVYGAPSLSLSIRNTAAKFSSPLPLTVTFKYLCGCGCRYSVVAAA